MALYQVQIDRIIQETGFVIVDATSKKAAIATAQELRVDSDDALEWVGMGCNDGDARATLVSKLESGHG